MHMKEILGSIIHLELGMGHSLCDVQGADGIRALFIIRKKNHVFNFARDHFQWVAESLTLLEAYAVKNRLCTNFTLLFFERHKALRAICAGDIF